MIDFPIPAVIVSVEGGGKPLVRVAALEKLIPLVNCKNGKAALAHC